MLFSFLIVVGKYLDVLLNIHQVFYACLNKKFHLLVLITFFLWVFFSFFFVHAKN